MSYTWGPTVSGTSSALSSSPTFLGLLPSFLLERDHLTASQKQRGRSTARPSASDGSKSTLTSPRSAPSPPPCPKYVCALLKRAHQGKSWHGLTCSHADGQGSVAGRGGASTVHATGVLRVVLLNLRGPPRHHQTTCSPDEPRPLRIRTTAHSYSVPLSPSI